MSKVTSSFRCTICKQPLNFPNNLEMVDFIILLLQFYKDHDRCEKILSSLKEDKKEGGVEPTPKQEEKNSTPG